jgi:hypothetical protein
VSKPDKPAPEFGSEVRRLETPEHHRQRRKRGISVSIFGIVLGLLLLAVGFHATQTGEMVTSYNSKFIPLTGGQTCLLALVEIAMCVWLLWRFLSNRQ